MFTYKPCIAEAHSVHAPGDHLHNLLWQGHKSRLLPLNGYLA